MRLYELSDDVYEYYKKNVKGNEKASYELAKKKLNRNLYLSRYILNDGNHRLYSYGHLLIEVKEFKIVFIKNFSPSPFGWSISNRKLLAANKKYGIYNAIKSNIPS